MKKYKKIICMIAAVCLLGTAAFCGFRIYCHYAHESEQEEVFEKIAEVVEQVQTGESEATDVLLTEEETVLAEYGELYLQNTDMVGWLSIAGTNINFPVMQTPNNPNYYLKHNFEKEYSDLGTPYVQENCDLLTSDNLVIYGHHIKGQKSAHWIITRARIFTRNTRPFVLISSQRGASMKSLPYSKQLRTAQRASATTILWTQRTKTTLTLILPNARSLPYMIQA